MRQVTVVGHTSEVFNFIRPFESYDTDTVIEGFLGEPICVMKVFTSDDGDEWEEFEQYEFWESGPNIFLGIKNRRTGEIKGWKLIKDNRSHLVYDYDLGTIWV